MPPTFAQLGVPESICRALASRGIETPFEIQAATIADALAGRDVSGRAPTGSGKTLAFGIPMVATLDPAHPKRPTGLILAPTRELADQIASELKSFAGDVRIGAVYGGVGYGPQLKQLRRGVDIVVACPGRLEDLIQRRDIDLSDVTYVVIDEADQMADMGFLPVVRRILDLTPDDRQTVMFSATLDGEVAKLAREYQHQPITHEVGDATPDITKAEHRFRRVDKTERLEVTANTVNEAGQAIVFCRTRHGADRVARQLGKHGINAAPIHGGHAQNRRTRSLDNFTKGKVQALVATDVAARGIHVDDVAAVIHFDPPADHKTYIHRSGRTARAGRNGVVVSLVQPDQIDDTRRLQSQLGFDLELSATNEIGPGSQSPTQRSKPANTRRRTNRGTKSNNGSNTGSARGSQSGSGQKTGGGQSKNSRPKRAKGSGQSANASAGSRRRQGGRRGPGNRSAS